MDERMNKGIDGTFGLERDVDLGLNFKIYLKVATM
jgi:hypothetical protein